LFAAAGSGILASDPWPNAWTIWAALFFVGAICSLLTGYTAPALVTVFLFFGFWHSYQVWSDEGYQLANKLTESQPRMVTALVVSAPTDFRWGRSAKQRFFAEVTELDRRSASFTALMEVSEQSVKYGDLIQVSGRLDQPTPPLNPGEFDYANYLRRKHAHLVLRSLSRSGLTIVARGAATPL
jgi:predicted membrane metal-binding protein